MADQADVELLEARLAAAADREAELRRLLAEAYEQLAARDGRFGLAPLLRRLRARFG